MFDLFKNSRLTYPLNWVVLWLSLAGLGYWLYFAFIEKAFLERMLGGTALFVDLLLGLPVVLIFALVVYALIYWGLKVLVILFLPNWLQRIESVDSQLSETLEEDDDLEESDLTETPPYEKENTSSDKPESPASSKSKSNLHDE